jgi:hypothetical protein
LKLNRPMTRGELIRRGINTKMLEVLVRHGFLNEVRTNPMLRSYVTTDATTRLLQD